MPSEMRRLRQPAE
jgi:hypothetical protein